MSFRILLIYPPTSQHESPGPILVSSDSDRLFMPYGMLTIVAELRARGFAADVLNLSTAAWPEAVRAVCGRPAELFGLSCYTFHRHAAAALGAEIKKRFPESHLTAGGPHVSALALEWLAHYPAFDSVVAGEGERAAVELAERLRDGQSARGLAGTASRVDGRPTLGPPRPFIRDLDSLAKPWEHFDYGVLITSRGCPGECTFCCSPRLWGRKIRFRSVENVLEEIDELVRGGGHRFLHVKDDTFTAPKRRVLDVCRGIVERGLVFRWVCDSRVDRVDPEILAAMRRAGCVKLNLGIESGSPAVLRNLKKRIDLIQAAKATADARELGLDVRFYLIVGNRGETPNTVHQTLQFVEEARPTSCLFHGLTLYPGTEEFEIARQEGLISEEDYFDETALASDSVNLGETSPEMRRVLEVFGRRLLGREQVQAPYTTDERERILARHPDMLLSHLDLALSYALEWRLDDAERVLRGAAEAFGRPIPEIEHYQACIGFARGDVGGASEHFRRAMEAAPNDTSLIRSRQTVEAAGPMDYQKQGEVAMRLLADLRSTELLFLSDGTRQLTVPQANPRT
ncbi:MAG: B12-binding domain-containing radical SAM protein [Planctomycetota bacterium]